MSKRVEITNKCTVCEACKHCKLVECWNDLNNVVNRFVEIHNTTSDVVFSNQLIYQSAMEVKNKLLEFERKLKQLKIDD